MIIVSACLAGINCRYDGTNCLNEEVRELVEKGRAVPVCPEQLGGLATPRMPADIKGGSGNDVLTGKAAVIDGNSDDISSRFIKGARETLKIARMIRAEKAILKSRSPSCGCGKDGKPIGVTAALLKDNEIDIVAF